MNCQISFYRNFELIDRYSPKQNPLSCFKDQIAQRGFVNVVYKVISKHNMCILHSWDQLMQHLGQDGCPALAIQACQKQENSRKTYIELTLQEQ